MTPDVATVLMLIGQVVLGGHFVVAGIRNMTSVPALTGLMAHRGLPYPQFVALGGIAWQTIAGLLVIFDLWASLAAGTLIVFTVLASVLFHDFWRHTGVERFEHTNAFQSNIAVAGGLLFVVALG